MDYLNGVAQQYAIPPFILAMLLAWSVVWKMWAVWRAARLGQKGWFIILFFVNTVGILEIIYLFVISKRKMKAQETKTEENTKTEDNAN